MTDRSASKPEHASSSREMVIGTSKPSWRDDARRSLGARMGALADVVRERRWPILAAAAVVALSGAGVVASVSGSATERADALQKAIADKETRVAALDADRMRHENRLAELQKQINARESQIAESEERVSALEKRRIGLERQVAELVAPVSAGGLERVSDAQEPAPEAPDPQASSSDASGTPPDETADRGPSAAAVDAAPVAARGPRPERIRAASRDDVAVETLNAEVRPVAGPVRVFIHVRSDDPAARERASAVAAELRRRGVAVAQIRGVRLPVRRDAVRFFYDQDRDAIPSLRDAVRSASPRGGEPEVRDFRSYGAPPKRGTIELWLS